MTLRLLLAASLALLALLPGCLSGTVEDKGEGDASGTSLVVTPDDGLPARGSPASLAHTHDAWAGRTEVTLVDAEFTPRFPCAFWRPDRPAEGFRAGCIFVEMGNGTAVYQGTSKLTLTASWSDPRVAGLDMAYSDAKGATDEFTPLRNGAPHEIPVTLETADMPHSKQSKWLFAIFGGGAPVGGVALEKVHITITITRGLDLPLDPPHPDFWGNESTLPLAEVSGVLKPARSDTLLFASEMDAILLPPGRIVPPGTTSLEVHFTWSVVDPAPGVTYHVMPFYRSAEHPFWERHREWEDADGPGTGRFVLEVESAMTDSPYATESQWRFTLVQYQNAPGSGLTLPSSWFGASPLDRDIAYTFRVVAHGSNEAMLAG